MAKSPEQLLISSVLRNNDLKVALAHGVTSDMFHAYDEEWQFLEEYVQKHKKQPSRAAFCSRFEEFRVQNVDDTAYLSDEVKAAHVKSSLVEAMNEIAEHVTDGDITQAVKVMSSTIVNVAAGIGTMGDGDIFTDFNDIVADIEARYNRAKSTGQSGIPYGIPTLDELTGGANPGELIIVAARLGQGKSWFMQHMAASAATAGHNVMFNALEQTRAQVTMRIHSLLAATAQQKFDSNNLMRGINFDIQDYKRFVRDLKKKMPGRLHVSDASRGKVSSATIRSQLERHSPDIVFIDYITLMSGTSDWSQIAEVSSELLACGINYQVPIVGAAQLNREYGLTKEPPGPEAIAQSDNIGRDATLVLTFKQQSQRVVMGRVAKYRNGPGDQRFYLQFEPGEGIIKEVSYNKAQDIIDEDKDLAAAAEDAKDSK